MTNLWKMSFKLFLLHHEVSEFLNNKNSILKNYFYDSKWLLMLAHLVDIFNMLHDLNVSMQDKMFNIFDQSIKIVSFKKTLLVTKLKFKKKILICV